ncbi:MAG: sigma factor-like helix-turn-helix DNA-binding protein [Acidobacteriota bacterium]
MIAKPKPPGSISRCIEVIKHSPDLVKRELAEEFIFHRYFPKLLRDAEESLRGISGADAERPPLSALRHGLTALREGRRPDLINRKQFLVEVYRRHNDRKQDEKRKNLRRGRPEDIDEHREIDDPRQKINLLCLEFAGLLNEEERRVFDLHYVEERSIPETATAIGCSPRKINMILKRIKDKIRTYLDSPPNLE